MSRASRELSAFEFLSRRLAKCTGRNARRLPSRRRRQHPESQQHECWSPATVVTKESRAEQRHRGGLVVHGTDLICLKMVAWFWTSPRGIADASKRPARTRRNSAHANASIAKVEGSFCRELRRRLSPRSATILLLQDDHDTEITVR